MRRERANSQRNDTLEDAFALGTEGGDARAVLGLVRALAAHALLACVFVYFFGGEGAGCFPSAERKAASDANEASAAIRAGRAPGPRSDLKSS